MDDFSTFCAEFRKNKEDKKADKAPRKENQPRTSNRVDPFDHLGINLNPKGTKNLHPETPQVHNNNTGFIEARLNRDNFWNLVFVFGMTLGFMITKMLDGNQTATFISVWSTILLVPFVVKRGSKITITEDKNFLNSAGENITKRCPNMFLVIVGSFALIAFVGLLFDKHGKGLSEILSSTIMDFSIFFIPTLFFILKNCPIALLFHKSAWRTEITGLVASDSSNKLFKDSSDQFVSARYSYLPWNIRNRH